MKHLVSTFITRCDIKRSRKGDAEIDVVALGRDRHVLLGPRAAQAPLALFARCGFTASVRRRAERENVLLVTAADIVATAARR